MMWISVILLGIILGAAVQNEKKNRQSKVPIPIKNKDSKDQNRKS
ncbi:MAG: hypothetical protein VX341_02955 [Bdellovibrionota bacterium]|nr:hypothetical protein [Bdellovibrionota bacterium]